MKLILSLLVAVMAAVILYAAFGGTGGLGWHHLIGLGASVLVLLIIWVYPGIDQPKSPPPG
ncbi:MAG: hypothetical protein U1E46_10710 [Hyphomicrobiales bacterium]